MLLRCVHPLTDAVGHAVDPKRARRQSRASGARCGRESGRCAARSEGEVWQHQVVSADDIEVSALAINVVVPEALRWTDTRRDETFMLTTLNVRLLSDGHLAAKAYGRPVGGGRGAYVSFRVPDRPELAALVTKAADRAGSLWAAHRGLPR
jgi:hypothetical protein